MIGSIRKSVPSLVGFTVLALLLTVPLPTSAAPRGDLTPEQEERIDTLFSRWDRTDSPGVALGVVKDGALVYAKGYGLADLEHDVEIEPSTVFYMASVSKHFVTFCILLLEEQGKLSLDDEIQRFLPDFPRYEAPLTIRHFIHHTSGVRDNLTLWSLAGNDFLDHIEDEAIYELIKRQKALNFSPGERQLYSNSCYFMLAMIIEKASGLSLRDFARENVFEPLGMNDTHFHDDVTYIVKNRAHSYEASPGSFQNLIMRYDLVGSGGLYSTVEDMFLWDQNFYDNALGEKSAKLIENMEEDGKLNNGESCNYAFGLVNGTFRGLRTVGHGGALAGYRTYYVRFPDQRCSIIVLANLSNIGANGLANAVAEVVLEDALEPKNEPPEEEVVEEAVADAETIELSEDELEQFTGTYIIQAGVDVTVSIEEASLHVKQGWNGVEYAISPTGKNTFVIPDKTTVKFTFSDIREGKAQTLVVDQPGSRTETRRKRAVVATDLEPLAGSYFSEELNVHYLLFVEDGVLKSRIRYRHSEPWTLVPAGEDRFDTGRVTFRFSRKDGKVVGFHIDAGRAQNIAFTRSESR